MNDRRSTDGLPDDQNRTIEERRKHIESWSYGVETALCAEEPRSTIVCREMEGNEPVTRASEEVKEEPGSVASLLGEIDLTAAVEQTLEVKKEQILEENPEGDHDKNESQRECGKDDTDQEARKLEEIEKYIAQQKRTARAKVAAQAIEAKFQKDECAIPSANASPPNVPDDQPNQQSGADDVIRRCLLSAIPSIIATPGTDILELISLDTLIKLLGLNIDLSDCWERTLMRRNASASIETFLAECAPDPYAWSILRREGPFTLNLWMVIHTFEQDRNRPRGREYLIGILEALEEVFKGDVKWEIVPDNVAQAVMRRAIAVAKEGPDPPGYEWGEDSRIDLFLAMVANKSESSLFGTPDTDNPRYWDFWMRRGGFGSNSS